MPTLLDRLLHFSLLVVSFAFVEIVLALLLSNVLFLLHLLLPLTPLDLRLLLLHLALLDRLLQDLGIVLDFDSFGLLERRLPENLRLLLLSFRLVARLHQLLELLRLSFQLHQVGLRVRVVSFFLLLAVDLHLGEEQFAVLVVDRRLLLRLALDDDFLGRMFLLDELVRDGLLAADYLLLSHQLLLPQLLPLGLCV